MVSPVGLNSALSVAPQGISASSLPIPGGQNASLFSPNPMSNAGCDYSNDALMSSMDFEKLATAAIQQTAAQVQNNNDSIQQVQNTPTNFGTNTPQSDTSLADEQEPKGSNIAKILCATGGFLAPLAGKAFSWAKGANPKTLFNLKQLSVTCPILGVAGLGVGMLLDACIDATKASRAEKIKAQIAQSSPSGQHLNTVT